MGRPTDYTIEIAARICDRVASGESLARLCQDEGMPARSTVYLWFAAHPEFSDNYARAREEQADFYADAIVDIADNPELDPNDKRVRIDARKWVASKLKSKQYGDKIDVDANVKVGLFGLLSGLRTEEGATDH
jgi:hypothetical protein